MAGPHLARFRSKLQAELERWLEGERHSPAKRSVFGPKGARRSLWLTLSYFSVEALVFIAAVLALAQLW